MSNSFGFKDLLKSLMGGGPGTAAAGKGAKGLSGFPTKDLKLGSLAAINPQANLKMFSSLLQGANAAINSKTTMGKFKGLLESLGGIGLKQGDFDGLRDQNPFSQKERKKWENMWKR